MDIINKMPTTRSKIIDPLKTSLQQILGRENLDSQRAISKDLITDLGADVLDFAAALLYLYQQQTLLPIASHPMNQAKPNPSRRNTTQPGIKMIRYRLEVGHKHQVTLEELTKVLVEESGVDKNNVINVDIQSLYTFIELPNEMPHDIFLHLKSVEINQQKLDIKRVKNRNHKKRVHHRSGRARQRTHKSPNTTSDKVYKG